ncbi:hypothetical protein SAMN05216343_11855 [Oscillibacter sp. PC13]|uniref:hypothetical protein n=1 Tax=Oscillibacter sp. PC13 TaxID=1855299 RepID=UPI0008F279D2|nr:hypothetical protein [Oscillibacter sp. PC13]SFP93102.1 hypothetical protein SAMN05216343_11855 [Oscillibacter sp. PC13]
MKQNTAALSWLLLGLTMLLAFRHYLPWEIPVMPVLYGLMTVYSCWFGVGCLRSDGHAPLWDQRGVPADVQTRFSRLQGVLFLLNAAVCPVGLLLSLWIPFDRDFVLITQILGLPLICLLGVLPLLPAGKLFHK